MLGLDPTVDALLGCSQSAPQASASSANSAAAAQEQLAAAPAVERSSTRATYLPRADRALPCGSLLLARRGSRGLPALRPSAGHDPEADRRDREDRAASSGRDRVRAHQTRPRPWLPSAV